MALVAAASCARPCWRDICQLGCDSLAAPAGNEALAFPSVPAAPSSKGTLLGRDWFRGVGSHRGEGAELRGWMRGDVHAGDRIC